MKRITTLCVIALILGCSGTSEDIIDAEYLSRYEDWQAKLTKGRENYLQLVGLFKMDEQVMRLGRTRSNQMQVASLNVPANIGTFTIVEGSIDFKASPGITITTDTDSVVTDMRLALDEYGNSRLLYCGDLKWRVIRRGGGPYLRIWDKNNPAIRAFKGFDRYPVDAGFIYDGRFEYYPDPQTDSVQSKLGVAESTQFVGQVHFEHNGQQHSLDVGPNGFTMVADETTGGETYGGGRYIYLDLPASDSSVTLDFNYLYNPPCVFSEYTTCLIPPPQNWLPFRLPVGETLVTAD